MLAKLYFKAVAKVRKALDEGGFRLLLVRFIKFSWQRSVRKFNDLFARPKVYHVFKDVLIVNGCSLQHPSRYRVDHKIEQLNYYGMTAEQVSFKQLVKRDLHLYRCFIFFRCEATDFIKEFVQLAKHKNKVCFFDIDDLIYDAEFVSTIEWLKELDAKYFADYMEHVANLGEMLGQCDYGITTTKELQGAMLQRLPEVYLNRNVASTSLVEFSSIARSLEAESNDSGLSFRIGYLSGSVTHNPDLAMIEDALVEVATRYPRVKIVLVGLVTASPKLVALGKQLERWEFSDWKKLPNILAKLDINLAPIEDTKFNRAKSENKWVEASLVGVPTVASNIGVFAEMIRDGVDGFLCSSSNEWVAALSKLVENEELRSNIIEAANYRALENHTTQTTGLPLVKFIESKLAPLYVFVVPTLMLSGGMRVILQHASVIKKSGSDVLIYVDADEGIHDLEYEGEFFSVISTREIELDSKVDTMVATLWTTVNRVLSQRKAVRKVYFVQNYEVDFYESNQLSNKLMASSSYMHSGKIEYVTISKWCQSWLSKLYGVNADYIPNGIHSSVFSSGFGSRPSWDDEIHVLVEGNSDDSYKNVDESMEIVARLKAKYGSRIICHLMAYRAQPKPEYLIDQLHFQVPFEDVVGIYKRCHLLIKSSKVESFSYPPIEMMATGGLVVVGGNPGNAEYVEHRGNCMVYKIGNINEAIQHVEELLTDSILRSKLIASGLKTAASRDWDRLEEEILSFWSYSSPWSSTINSTEVERQTEI